MIVWHSALACPYDEERLKGTVIRVRPRGQRAGLDRPRRRLGGVAMAEPEPVVIIGVGARTPVGFTAASSAAAVRAGISVIEEHPFMIDRFGEPMKVTRDVGLDVAVTGAARAIEIGLDAAREALAVLDGRDAPPVSVLVSTGEDRPGQPPGHAAAVFAGLAERLAATVRIDRGGYLAAGHAGGLLAMLRARDALRTGRVRLCLVGGVDSYLEAETLEWLDETEQLHSEGNIYGFCPGEGAGFCLMSTLATARALGCRPLLELVSIAARARGEPHQDRDGLPRHRPRHRLPPRLRGGAVTGSVRSTGSSAT